MKRTCFLFDKVRSSLGQLVLQLDRTTIVLSVLVLIGCGTDDTNDPVLARAFDNELHWSDLRQVIPVSASDVDSAALAQRYITSWSRDQVLLHRAEQNLGEEQKDFVSANGRLSKGRLIYATRKRS